MSLKSELKSELKSRRIAFKNLNKRTNKKAKEEILARLVRRGAIEGYSKEKLSKELRKIKIDNQPLKFSNRLIRDLYDRSVLSAKKKPATALPKTARPRPDKIRSTQRKSGHALGAYFYIIKAYLKRIGGVSKKEKTRNIPARAIKVTNDRTYHTTQDFVLISEDILSRTEVAAAAMNMITGEKDEETLSDISFNASGLNNIDFKTYILVAYEYRDVVKDF